MKQHIVVLVLSALLLSLFVTPAAADDPLDPAHNLPLPCEALATPGLAPRSAKNIVHVANVCGFVGTDMEFQSRTLADGSVRDYAFVGTMGAGTRIFDVTDPAHPVFVGGYTDPGWENDLQVRGDLLVLGFDPLTAATAKASACLTAKSPTAGGVDLVQLVFDATNGTFTTRLIDCVVTVGGSTTSQNGAHNVTIHPSGDYLVMINPRGNGSLDLVDLRGGTAVLRWRYVQDRSLSHVTCTALRAPAQCRSIGRAGTWSPHDVSFSADGRTAYVAAVFNDTLVLDVSGALDGAVSVTSVIPNDWNPDPGIGPQDLFLSHQADTTSDGRLLLATDERGGGLDETGCNQDPGGVIGGGHVWALAPISGVASSADASPANPRRLGAWYYPNPLLAVDLLSPVLAMIGRTERACTIHVFRFGGNGSAGPGPAASGFDGVSRLPARELTTAHYGAGVWHLDMSGPPSAADGIPEDSRTTWGNTLGWNVMPGADTWSAKEYKGFIYASDMGRGFDVYAFASCEGAGCVALPTNTPGSATGGGKLESEVLILRGTNPQGKANFGLDVSFGPGSVRPSGELTFRDKAAGRSLVATAFDSFTVAGSRATITGRGTLNGVAAVRFFVEVEDLGPTGADAFRVVLSDGYGAAGVVTKGDIRVSGGASVSDGALAYVPLAMI